MVEGLVVSLSRPFGVIRFYNGALRSLDSGDLCERWTDAFDE